MSVVLTLLVVSVFINYVDRGNLSIAAPILKNELGISASQLGILLSSFFWTYTALLFVCGWFVDPLTSIECWPWDSWSGRSQLPQPVWFADSPCC